MDGAYYVGFGVGDQEIGLDPNGHSTGMTGPAGYWDVSDIEERLRSLRDEGTQTQPEVKDVGEGKLVAAVRDQDDNVGGVVQSP